MSIQIDNDELVQGEDLYGFGQQHIVETLDGKLYTAQINSLGYIEIHVSTNNGLTWNQDTVFDDVINPRQLTLDTSNANDIFLSYVQNLNTAVVKRKHSSTGVWSTVFTHDRQSSSGLPISAMIYYSKTASKLFIFIQSNYRDTTPGPTLNNFYGYISSDFGATWGDIISASGTINTTTSSGAIFGIVERTSMEHICIFRHLNNVGSSSSGGLISLVDFNGATVTSNASVSAYGVTGGCCVKGLDSYFIRIRKYSTNGNIISVFRFNSGSTYVTELKSFSFGTTFPVALGEWSASCDNQDNIYIFYTKSADGYCYFRKYTVSADELTDEAVFSKDNEGNPIIGRRPSCMQTVINSGNKIHVIYSTT